MKKNGPKILAVVLLSVVAVLMAVAGSGSLLDVFSKNPNSQGAVAPPNTENDANDGNANESIPSGDNSLNAPEVENDFPIPSTTGGSNRFTQSISLQSPSLNAVHDTVSGTYVIFTHSTDNGAFKVAKRSQTIMKIDSQGNVISATSLQAPKETEYLSSKITLEGLVVATKGGNRTLIYTISYDFSQVDILELSLFSQVELFSLNEGFLLFGKSKENTVYKIKNNVVLSSNTLQAGELKAVYDFSNYYTLFLSGINSYSTIKLSDSLKLLSSVTIPSKTLMEIEPIVENGEQKYIAVELSSSGVEIAKYSTNFSIQESERVGVGMGDSVEVFMNSESILLLLHSTTERLYLVDKGLNFTSSTNNAFQGISKCYDCTSTSNGYKVLYSKEHTLTLVDLRNDGTLQSLNLDTQTDKAFISLSTEGEVAVVFVSQGSLEIIGIV